MLKKKTLVAGFAAFSAVALTIGCASGAGKHPYTQKSSEELAEYLIFETNSFRLDQDVQEGGKAVSRMKQDDLQKACSVTGGDKPDAKTLAEVNAKARATIKYPEGGIRLGDWKKGGDLAWSGFGYRIGHKNDNHKKKQPGGNCYNCHELTADRTGGTIGPDLRGYGKKRGSNKEMIKFAYDMIYNPHATFPCTAMPRFGYKGLLTQEQISDILAFLFDPKSPVNQ